MMLLNLSILVTCYNKVEYIQRFSENLFALENAGAEIIIVDDHSSDKSRELLESKLMKSNHTHIIYNSQNIGSAASRNLALSFSTRDYVFFWDIDDEIEVSSLLRMLSLIETHNSDLCVASFSNGNKNEFVPSFELDFVNPIELRTISQELLEEMGFWRYLYSKRFITKNNLQFMPTFEDMGNRFFILDDVFWMLLLTASNGTIIDLRKSLLLYRYQQNNNSYEAWNRFLSQASLFPKATILFLRYLQHTPINHSSAAFNALEKSRIHLSYLGVLKWILNFFEILGTIRLTSKFKEISLGFVFRYLVNSFLRSVRNTIHRSLERLGLIRV